MKLELKRKEVRTSIYIYTCNFNETDLKYLNDYLQRVYGSNIEHCPQVTMEDVKRVYNNDWYEEDDLLKDYKRKDSNSYYPLGYAVQDYLNDLVWDANSDEVDGDTEYVEDWTEEDEEEDEEYDGEDDYRYDTNDR